MSSSATASSHEQAKIESVDPNALTISGNVNLSDRQKTLVGCVLDLFAGKPSLAKLRLWDDAAIFEDMITNAKGRKEYEAQWYGLATVFSAIERKKYQVVKSGNPIVLKLDTVYTVKGLGTKKEINSEVEIFHDDKTGLITHVKDKWNGELPEGGFKELSLGKVLSPGWWLGAWAGVGWWAFVNVVCQAPGWEVRPITSSSICSGEGWDAQAPGAEGACVAR